MFRATIKIQLSYSMSQTKWVSLEKNPKEFTKNLLELIISEFNKFAGYKVNVYKVKCIPSKEQLGFEFLKKQHYLQ